MVARGCRTDASRWNLRGKTEWTEEEQTMLESNTLKVSPRWWQRYPKSCKTSKTSNELLSTRPKMKHDSCCSAYKKTLRDRDDLTPAMEQFYESGVRILRKKLERIDRAGEGYPDPPERDRFAKVRPTWHDVALGRVKGDPPTRSLICQDRIDHIRKWGW